MSKDRELDTEEWKNVVDQLIRVFSVRFFRLVGGEPFLHPGFKDTVHHIKTKGCRLTVVTNGTLIDAEMAHFLVSERVDRIRISIDGHQMLDDFYRGNGAFVRTLKGIEAIFQENGQSHFHNTRIEIHPFVSKVNCKEIRSLLSLSRKFEADFSFHYLKGAMGEELSRTEDPGFPKDSQEPSVMSLEEKKNFENEFAALLPLQERFLSTLSSKIGKLPIWPDCARASFHFLIDPWGRVFPCENLYDHSYGNCRDGHVKEIWMSQKRAILRHNIRKGDLQACQICGHRKFTLPMILAKLPFSKLDILPILKFVER